jgi:hypothetical protein
VNEDFPVPYTQSTGKMPLLLTVRTEDFIHAQGLLIFAALILATVALVDLVALFMPKE